MPDMALEVLYPGCFVTLSSRQFLLHGRLMVAAIHSCLLESGGEVSE